MTSVSVAASTASSNSCRSSLRGSRSPVNGPRASTSSPSVTPTRGKTPVVEAEQAHDPVRHGPHRHQRRDREHAGAEVGARRPAGEPVGEHRADVGEAEVDVRRPAPDAQPVELALHLPELPGVGRPDRRQRADTVLDRLQPVVEGVGADEPVGDRSSRVDELGQPADQVDVAAADVVQRQASPPSSVPLSSDIATPASSRSSPARQVFVVVAVQPEVGPVRRVEAPLDAGLLDPGREQARGRRRGSRTGGARARRAPGRARRRRPPGRRPGRAAGRPRPAAGWSGRGPGRRGSPAAGARGGRRGRPRRPRPKAAESSGA